MYSEIAFGVSNTLALLFNFESKTKCGVKNFHYIGYRYMKYFPDKPTTILLLNIDLFDSLHL